jgi:hypothetical protein
MEVVDFIRGEFDTPLITKGVNVEEIGKQYLALQLAKSRFDSAVARLQAISDQEMIETQSYK